MRVYEKIQINLRNKIESNKKNKMTNPILKIQNDQNNERLNFDLGI